ncbi:hypothetical protein ACMFMG_011073 [Clarireedia jacksonii]
MRSSKSFFILQNGVRSVAQRPLHTTPRVYAGSGFQRGAKQKQTRIVPINTPKALPPLSVLEENYQSGHLDVKPSAVLDFLKQYQLLSHQATAGWEHGLCKRYQMSPVHLTKLSVIIGSCSSSEQKSLARHLMISAANLGEKQAIVTMARHAFLTGSLDASSNKPILQQLSLLAKKEKHLQATSLLSEILISQGREKEALDHLRDAVSTPIEKIDNAYAMGEACALFGKILIRKGAREEAEKVLRKGALEYDNAFSYFYLSNLQADGTDEKIMFLEKAAASGITEACHNLGVIELEKIEREIEERKSIGERGRREMKDYGLAREWFEVAAEGGFGLSMLNLITICRAEGRAEEGDKWQRRAEEVPEVRREALKLGIKY